MEIIIQEARDPNKSEQRATNLINALKFKKQITVFIDVCSICNLKCNFCDVHSGRFKNMEKEKGMMDEKLYYKIINDLSELGYKLKALYFHGWGEPLLQKKLPEMIHHAYEKGVAEEYRLITNGTLMNKDIFEKLLVSGLDEIRISMDTIYPEYYHKVKGRDLINTLLENVDYAISRVASQNKLKLYIKIPGTDSVSNHYGLADNNVQFVINRFKDINNPNVKIMLLPLVIMTGNEHQNYNPCELAFCQALIKYDGRVSVCCADVYDRLNIGNITQQSMIEILNGEKLRKIRMCHAEDKVEKISACVYCGARPLLDIRPYAEQIKKILKV